MEQAMEVIGSGDLTKVVLSRRMIFHGDGPFSIETILDSLCKTYPFCSVFAVGNGLESFIGASPEDLVRLENGQVRVSCLAGSAVRGTTLDEEERLIKQLSNSAKDRREHEVVVAAISQGLRKVCKDVQWDSEPRIVQLPTIQHLATFFTASAPNDSDILQIVSALHPTPAVGGVPTERALNMIRCLEGDRGWYAGPVGWVDFHGEGQFNVAIRSALVKGNQATLFAGSGIVEGSDPAKEFKETNWKFQPLLNALHQR
jgi:menaquinone-specific isochorismate synthase